MQFLQQGTAQTTSFMILGYTVIFSVMLVYLISLAIRSRNLQRELEMLENLDNK